MEFKITNDEEFETEDWGEDELTLEELLFWNDESDKDEYEYISEGWGGMPFEFGDIVMTNENQGGISIHRIYIVNSLIDPDNGPEFEGFEMSSNIRKANINNPRYPQNILIKNYGSILDKGLAPNKDVIIKIDQLFQLDSDSFVERKPLKGRCKELFNKFIRAEVAKYENGLDTSKDYWDNGVPHIEKN